MVGCASQATPSATQHSEAQPQTLPPRTASALVFDPPIALSMAMPDLARDNRGQAALVGFEEPSISNYDVFTYDRQSGDQSDYYDQEAVSERVGTTHR